MVYKVGDVNLVDEKDLKILEILLKNSRTPYTDIAKEVGISDVAVIKRVKKLEHLGIIRGYTTIIDYDKLNYSFSLTGIDVDPAHLYDVIDVLKSKDCVKYLFLTTGDHSLIALIVAKSNAEMSEIHRELANIVGIKRVCPSIITELIKC